MPTTKAESAYRSAPEILGIADMIGDVVSAADFPQTTLRWRNDRAAGTVGLAGFSDAAWIDHFARFAPLPDNLPQPLALRYHGHQFGTYNPELGDGRGFLFAQLRDGDGRLLDLGTKGSGQTPYSRFGDGRLTLKGAVRELLATEMLEALGVPTSRTFSIIETGEALHRGDEPSPTRSAVMVRLNHSHIRIGSFQRLAALQDGAAMERLLRYTLTHYVDAGSAALPVDQAAAALVAHTARASAAMVASYMVAGFVHGVLNTDNINITGESFDYGPWRFTPQWDAGFVAAYFDHQGLYAFGRQPQVLHWNVGQLAISLSTIAATDALTDALALFGPAYETALARQFCWRLGVAQADAESDRALVLAAERYMRASGCAIDQFFIDWAGGHTPPAAAPDDDSAQMLARALAGRAATRKTWWDSAPPQSLYIEEVEALWAPIAEQDDWSALYAKVAAIRAMGTALASSE
ncbi:MAG: YdiU family protein [Sphingopyxis sp.]|nr:YdiU family protein [Sphingopyxis sp.]